VVQTSPTRFWFQSGSLNEECYPRRAVLIALTIDREFFVPILNASITRTLLGRSHRSRSCLTQDMLKGEDIRLSNPARGRENYVQCYVFENIRPPRLDDVGSCAHRTLSAHIVSRSPCSPNPTSQDPRILRFNRTSTNFFMYLHTAHHSSLCVSTPSKRICLMIAGFLAMVAFTSCVRDVDSLFF
jgi:hypothetical protein